MILSKRKSKIGRNDLCHCGSGKKYKNCCLTIERNSSNKTASGLGDYNKSKKMEIPSINNMRKNIKSAEAIKKIANANVNNPHLPPVLKNIDWNEVSDSASEVIKFKNDIELPGYFNYHFSDLGWISYNSINAEIMKKTVDLADEGKFKEAEDVLIDYYSPKNIEVKVKWFEWVDEFKPRMKLIETAFEDYKVGRYYSCILVLITVIDGIVFDNKDTGNKGFFGKDNALKTSDDIVTHVTGLPALQVLLSSPRTSKSSEELTIPFRNGIVHGRDLDYSNVMVAAKLWGTLFALKDGIIAIKNEKKANKEEKPLNMMETFKSVEEMSKRDKIMNSYAPRQLKPIIDYPISGKALEYDLGAPERTLVKLFEYWSDPNPNYGAMGEMMDAFFIDNRTFGTVAGDLSRNIFNKKKLSSFKILNIVDETIGITKIKVELKINKEGKELTEKCIFKLIYEDDEGKSDFRGMPDCSWKIMEGLNHIKNI